MGKRIESLGHPGAKEACQVHTSLRSLGRTGAAADLACDDQGAHILFNQIEAFNDDIATHPDKYSRSSPFDLDKYIDCHITNTHDRELIDTFISNETGTMTFPKGSDGYYALAGGHTGKAKWSLAAQLGKKITQVCMEKEKALNEQGKIITKYYTTYWYQGASS